MSKTNTMAYENKPNTGAMFKNEKKESDKHPDYTGTYYDKDGVKQNMAMWLNESKTGKKYFAMAGSEWREADAKSTPKAAVTSADADDLPF
tara:strand:+ start:451 stop:723 length:273 start_codon:yes stop_codon:yes gene_type:complete